MNKEEIIAIFYDKEKMDIWHKFKEIENTIDESNDIYKYFDDIKKMLLNEKSYIKMRGFRIICRLSKWDEDNKINDIIKELLAVLDDDKPTIVRMCLDSMKYLLIYKPELDNIVKDKLDNIDFSKYKDTMSPLIKKDINDLLKYL